LRYEHDSSTIRVRFEHDLATTRYEMRTIRARFEHDTTSYDELCAFEQYEHVNSFALLQDVAANQRSRGGASIYTMT